MIRKRLLAPTLLVALPALAGCVQAGGTDGARPQSASMPANIGSVVGQNAAGLVNLFGSPDADVREGTARKLQFESAICVLDAYLYPKGRAEPRVTWVDTRQRDGKPIDRASCVAALTRRDGGK